MAHALAARQFRLGRTRHLVIVQRALAERTEELRRLREESIRLLAAAMDLRDDATGSHSARTADYAYAIARRLRVPDRRAELIRLAMPLHDIGKIALPDRILHKPGPLTEIERRVMQTH